MSKDRYSRKNQQRKAIKANWSRVPADQRKPVSVRPIKGPTLEEIEKKYGRLE